VDRSLVTASVPDGTAEPRYRLLDSPRAYALERLKEAGEEKAVRRRHTQAVAAFCDAAWHQVFSGEVGWQDWLLAFQLDGDDAREAMSQARSMATTSRDRVATPQIGTTRLHASCDMPAARQPNLAEQCTAQVDDSVPPSLRMRIRLRVALTLVGIQPGLALEAARTAWNLDPHGAAPGNDGFLPSLAAFSVAMAVGRRSGGVLVHPQRPDRGRAGCARCPHSHAEAIAFALTDP